MTCSGFIICSGNVHSQQGVCNANLVLNYLNRTDIPIYQGRTSSLYQPYIDARDTHGEDGLGEVYFAKKGTKNKMPAANFIVNQINDAPGDVTIVALGPLTNLADALAIDPSVLAKAKGLRIMGGVHTVTGNCSPVAEYNFWCDPVAAKKVFTAALSETYLYTLDVTYDILFTPNMREMINQFGTPLAEFIHDITRFYVDFHWNQERTLGCIINDPLVIADMIEPMTEFEEAQIDVVIEGDSRGQGICIPDAESRIHVSKSVDATAFFDLFFNNLFPDFKMDIKLMKEKGMI